MTVDSGHEETSTFADLQKVKRNLRYDSSKLNLKDD